MTELWRREYAQRRYLEHADTPTVHRRFKDIMVNSILLTDDVKIGLPPPGEELRYWMRLGTHVMHEMELRPNGWLTTASFRDMDFLGTRSPLATPAAAAVVAYRPQLPSTPYLVKYGKVAFLRETLEQGRIRIAPASSYADPSLNGAIRDDELRLAVHVDGKELVVEIVDPATGKVHRATPVGHATFTLGMRTDYYVGCFAQKLAPRLFVDFDADGAIIVKNPDELLRRIVAAMERVNPGLRPAAAPIRYIDPFHVADVRKVGLPFAKHFRYAYQNEFRVAWAPPKEVERVDSAFLDLSDLRDIAELLVLS